MVPALRASFLPLPKGHAHIRSCVGAQTRRHRHQTRPLEDFLASRDVYVCQTAVSAGQPAGGPLSSRARDHGATLLVE